jgi:hypothetical protein
MWGITRPELNRLSDAVHFMEIQCQPRRAVLWLATTARATSRSLIADVWKRITRLQGACGLRCYSVLTFENSGGIHAHIVFIGTRDIARRLKESKQFGEMVDLRPVTDPNGLVRKYLAKERTPQAGYRRAHVLGGRIQGSHKLPGGGDRVRLSRELERDAIEASYVEPWTHTNAHRSTARKPYRPRPLTRRAPRPAGQLPLLPELERPVSRLREFGGGFVPPAVALEIEFRRQRLGLSQRQVGNMIGRTQGQLANALRGHDPISVTAINRLRDVLKMDARPER